MKAAVKLELKTNTFDISRSYTHLREKEISLVNSKFYQKLLVLLISFLIILIIPESPRVLGNICENYNSEKICNVW
tara:strand:+ start:494 stop:721 length:228 start_codon:yes stop_codon:yes gene_type:complete